MCYNYNYLTVLWEVDEDYWEMQKYEKLDSGWWNGMLFNNLLIILNIVLHFLCKKKKSLFKKQIKGALPSLKHIT